MRRLAILLVIIIPIICISIGICAAAESDVLVWQGQYYTGTNFNTGTYEFNFTVYDALTGGDICYSNTTTLTTGNFGEWKTEQYGVSSVCNNISKNYYLNINIDGVDQTPRRRLVVWNFLRKDVDETTIGTIAIGLNTSTVLSPTMIESEFVKVNNKLIENNVHLKLSFSEELANITLAAQEDFALAQIIMAKNISSATVGESIELKKVRLNSAAELAKELINTNAAIAKAKLKEARELAKLGVETEEGEVVVEEEARLAEIALNLTAAEKKLIVEEALNSSLAEIEADDDGIRFCLSDGTNCMSSLGNPFNQVLNTTSDVAFNNITANTGFFSYLGSLVNRITALFVQDIDASGNVNAANYTLNGTTIRDWNDISSGIESDPKWSANFTNMQTDCPSNNYVYGVNGNGTLKCRQDQTGGGSGLTPVYLGSDLTATNAAYTSIFTIALTPSKMNIIQAYLAQSSSTNGVAIQNRAIISESGPIGNCHFETQTQSGTEVVDNIAVSTDSADTGITIMGLDANVPFINKIICTVLADANPRDLIIQFDSENANNVTTHAGSYYINAVN